MIALLRQCLGVFLALTLVTGVAYPALVTLIAQGVFPRQANGSVIERDGRAVGSALLGQPFSGPGYFWGRPSATAPQPYNGAASNGSNQAPTQSCPGGGGRRARRGAARRGSRQLAPVPIDLVTASGSGLDPHVSPAAAEYQAGAGGTVPRHDAGAGAVSWSRRILKAERSACSGNRA